MSIEIVSYRKYEKNTLQGFLSIRMTGIRLEIRDLCIHQKNGKRWLSLPAKPVPSKEINAKPGYVSILDFYDKTYLAKFQTVTLMALDSWLSEHPESLPEKRGIDAIPF